VHNVVHVLCTLHVYFSYNDGAFNMNVDAAFTARLHRMHARMLCNLRFPSKYKAIYMPTVLTEMLFAEVPIQGNAFLMQLSYRSPTADALIIHSHNMFNMLTKYGQHN